LRWAERLRPSEAAFRQEGRTTTNNIDAVTVLVADTRPDDEIKPRPWARSLMPLRAKARCEWSPPRPPCKTPHAEAGTLALISAEKLSSLVLPSGKFIYSYSHQTGTRDKGYNVARHAGALWSILATYPILMKPRSGLVALDAASRGMHWLLQSCGRMVDDQAVWIADRNARKVALGANALTLLAATEWCTLFPGEQHCRLCWSLAAGIMRMMNSAGTDFDHKYLIADGQYFRDGFRSIYYTGEALFGMLRYFGTCLSLPQGLRSSTQIESLREWMPRLIGCMLHPAELRRCYSVALDDVCSVRALPDCRSSE
jgi:hypothetical protein